jgi:hypothetical protein
MANSAIHRSQIISMGNRIIQVSEMERTIETKPNEVWYQIDHIYRSENTAEFKQKAMRLRYIELLQILDFVAKEQPNDA